MKPLRIDVKARNNLLVARREAAGLSAPAFARMLGISYGRYLDLENLCSPLNRDGSWHRAALAVADHYRVMPGDLWPDAVLAVERTRAVVYVDEAELRQLRERDPIALLDAPETPEDAVDRMEMTEALRAALATLPLRCQGAIVLRFGLDGGPERTLDEVGEALSPGVHGERARQLIAQGLRMLRQRGVVETMEEWSGRAP